MLNHRKKIILIGMSCILVLVCLLSLNLEGQDKFGMSESDYTHNYPYIPPLINEFPIIASGVISEQYGPDNDVIKGVEECGFNLVMQISTTENIKKLLSCLDSTSLKAILRSGYIGDANNTTVGWQDRLYQFVDEFKNNSKTAGWELRDEPHWDDLLKYRDRYRMLYERDSTHLIIINLVGVLNKKFTGPCKTLESYLDTIQNYFKPSVWSSDCYPIMVVDGKTKVEYDAFYNNLETFAKFATKTDRPMWQYCESMSYIGKGYAYPEANEAYLGFEAFSALAYGAQGIVYWTYYPSDSGGTDKIALVDIFGNKTPSWYAAKEVNYKIKALTPIFLNAKYVESCHSGNLKIKGAKSFSGSFGPIKNVSENRNGFLITHMRNNGYDYIVFVNHDVTEKQNIKFELEAVGSIKEIVIGKDYTLSQQDVPKYYKGTVAPGDMKIFICENWPVNQSK